MLIKKHVNNYLRFKPYYKNPFLMLGNQKNLLDIPESEFFEITDYKTMDLDNGDYKDLTANLDFLFNKFETVFNLGTIEHIWDSHTAWQNALRITKEGGYFIGVSPVYGYWRHGIHITDSKFIIKFIENNMFKILDYYYTDKDGNEIKNIDEIMSGKHKLKEVLFWYASKKQKHLDILMPPSQIYHNGSRV